jgi:hypothetical protein
MFRSKHVEPSVNFGIINSITKLHLVGISTESSTIHGSMNIKSTLIMLCKYCALVIDSAFIYKSSHCFFKMWTVRIFETSEIRLKPTCPNITQILWHGTIVKAHSDIYTTYTHTRPDQKVSGLSSFLLCLTSHCDGTLLGVSCRVAPVCRPPPRHHCSHAVWPSSQANSNVCGFIVFVTSDSTEHGVSIKFGIELKQNGNRLVGRVRFLSSSSSSWFSDQFFIAKRLLC